MSYFIKDKMWWYCTQCTWKIRKKHDMCEDIRERAKAFISTEPPSSFCILHGYSVDGRICIVSPYCKHIYMQPHRHCEIPCQAKLFLQFFSSLQFDYHRGVWSFKKDQPFPLFVRLGVICFPVAFFLVKAETKLSFQLLHRLIFWRKAERFSCLLTFE